MSATFSTTKTQNTHTFLISESTTSKPKIRILASLIILSLPLGANPRFLLPCKDKFLDFLKNGGSIVSFGEITQDYLPNIAWKEYSVNFWWWLSEGADMLFVVCEGGKSLFEKMSLFTAKWHYHGAFYPPKDCINILQNELGEAIIYKDISFKGGLYVTSLDPDFHLGQGFIPKTEPFFDNFMEWIEKDILENKLGRKLEHKEAK